MSKPNQKEIKKKPLAFGVLPETHRYRLRMARMFPMLCTEVQIVARRPVKLPEPGKLTLNLDH